MCVWSHTSTDFTTIPLKYGPNSEFISDKLNIYTSRRLSLKSSRYCCTLSSSEKILNLYVLLLLLCFGFQILHMLFVYVPSGHIKQLTISCQIMYNLPIPYKRLKQKNVLHKGRTTTSYTVFLVVLYTLAINHRVSHSLESTLNKIEKLIEK